MENIPRQASKHTTDAQVRVTMAPPAEKKCSYQLELPCESSTIFPPRHSTRKCYRFCLRLHLLYSQFRLEYLGIHWCILQLKSWQFVKSIIFRSIKAVCCAQRIVRFVSTIKLGICFLFERFPFTNARKHLSYPRQRCFLRPVSKTSEIESQICNISKLDFRAYIEVYKLQWCRNSMCPIKQKVSGQRSNESALGEDLTRSTKVSGKSKVASETRVDNREWMAGSSAYTHWSDDDPAVIFAVLAEGTLAEKLWFTRLHWSWQVDTLWKECVNKVS